jgi:hypothetical protein
VGIISVLLPGVVFGQTVPAAYDAAQSLTLRGIVAAIVLPPGSPAFLVLDVPTAAGDTERWAIQGNPTDVLIANGWRPRGGKPIGIKNTIEIVVYRLRSGVDATGIVPSSDLLLAPIAKTNRVVYGTQITLPEGGTISFGGGE